MGWVAIMLALSMILAGSGLPNVDHVVPNITKSERAEFGREVTYRSVTLRSTREQSTERNSVSERFAVAPFSIDVTIPLEHRCMGVLPVKSRRIVDPLQAHGLIVWGAERPVVFCAVDWCEIRNGAYDRLREVIASAAGTEPHHVLLSALHQHDAPVVDTDAQRLLDEVGLHNELFQTDFFADCLRRLEGAIRDAVRNPQPCTHFGLGKAEVVDIASNRRVIERDGTVSFRRGSRSATDVELAAADAGEIDPWLRTLSFWNGDRPLAAIHSYATHPMSHYGQGEVSYDFVGLARERMRRSDASIQQIYVSACSGDVTAGKFNDGSPQSRLDLADRLFDAMNQAWNETERFPLVALQLNVEQIHLPWHPKRSLTPEALRSTLADSQQTIEQRILAAMGLASWQRVDAKRPIDLCSLDLFTTDKSAPSASVVLFPGEAFVGYQLHAQQLVKDRFLMPIGYGESWTGYLPTSNAFTDGFDDFWLWVGPESELVLHRALEKLLLWRQPAPNSQNSEQDPPTPQTATPQTHSPQFVSTVNQDDGTAVDFQRDIRPLLSDTCWRCHGPDDGHREAGLRLDTREGALLGGDSGAAIVPGNPEQSLIVQRVTAHGSDRMPPEDAGAAWSPAAIERLTQWIAEGAHYEPHWAYREIEDPPVPDLPRDAWSRKPLDRFVLSPLNAQGFDPSPDATREVLLRRLSLDLRGIPADVEERQRFLQDAHPDAESRLVDRLLGSPHFGERWGRHWLDQARYADSHGYTVDGERTIWPYRDWVIDAINRDLPFDQFTIEQLAGDLLPQASLDQRVATGFHRNTLINQEGGVDGEQFRVEAMMDRANTTGAVWLGLTVGCAQCHNHKYDPLTQKEYYQLYAFFNSGTDVNNSGAQVAVPSPDQTSRLKALEQRLAQATQLLEAFDREHPELAQPISAEQMATTRAAAETWQSIEQPQALTRSKAALNQQEDGSWLATGPVAASDEYRVTIRATEPRVIRAVRIETLIDASLPQQGPGRAGNGNFVLCELGLQDARGTQRIWSGALAEHSQDKYPVSDAIDGKLDTGWAINVGNNQAAGPLNSNRTAWFALAQPLELAANETAEIVLAFGDQPAGYPIGRFRLSVSATPIRELGFDDAQRQRLLASLEQAKRDREQVSAQIPRTMIMADLPQPRPTHVLERGDFLRLGEPVEPNVPAWLTISSSEALDSTVEPTRLTRLDLAHWLVSSSQPLTPRVTVNRWWMRLFGRGLVETENDFGAQGALPTHPELLEHLAAQLISRDWSRKMVLRQIVLSSTYQQASHIRSDLQQRDPTNRWLARQFRVRVEGEIVRDVALVASGTFSNRVGGPSVYPPQPAGVYAFTQRAPNWRESQGSDRYRRGMYTFFYRSSPHPLLTTFDAPKFETTCTRRTRSNTPLQSLTLSNDSAFLELAGAWGWRIAQQQADDRKNLEGMFLDGLGRSAEPQEVETLLSFIEQERARLNQDDEARKQWLQAVAASRWGIPEGADPLWETEVGVWASVARVVMNLDEFITRE